jgi:hypothetical protein
MVLRKSFLLSFGLVLGLSLVFATAAFTQSGDNTGLSGRILDATGAAVPNASILIVRGDTGDTSNVGPRSQIREIQRRRRN